MAQYFHDRTEAGRLLAKKLVAYANRGDVLVLALPRGGVPVAFEVAKALQAPLDVFLVRKLGVPGHEELAMGAIASGGMIVRNDEVIAGLGVPSSVFETVVAQEQQELERQEHLYRGDQPLPDLHDCTTILVDDGLATGATMRAAVAALCQHHPAHRVVAVPIAAPNTCEGLRADVDEVICALTPEPFYAVGVWYEHFSQTTDDEVQDLLAQAKRPRLQDQTPQAEDAPEQRRA
jgi:putative phosphoribosyl transferase